MEEAKGHEIIKLQNSLQAMQSKLDETNELLVYEREAARKAIEEAPPVIKETTLLFLQPSQDSMISFFCFIPNQAISHRCSYVVKMMAISP